MTGLHGVTTEKMTTAEGQKAGRSWEQFITGSENFKALAGLMHKARIGKLVRKFEEERASMSVLPYYYAGRLSNPFSDHDDDVDGLTRLSAVGKIPLDKVIVGYYRNDQSAAKWIWENISGMAPDATFWAKDISKHRDRMFAWRIVSMRHQAGEFLRRD